MAFSIKAMWNYQCPRCRHGSIFATPFQLSKPLEMPKRCAYCDQSIEPEPGFYYGAMFVSYILMSWFILLPTLLLVFYFKFSVEAAMGVALLLTAVTYLKFLRGSRSMWLHLMVKHDPAVEERVKQHIEDRRGRQWKPNLKSSEYDNA